MIPQLIFRWQTTSAPYVTLSISKLPLIGSLLRRNATGRTRGSSSFMKLNLPSVQFVQLNAHVIFMQSRFTAENQRMINVDGESPVPYACIVTSVLLSMLHFTSN
jgi:hypothetical protein